MDESSVTEGQGDRGVPSPWAEYGPDSWASLYLGPPDRRASPEGSTGPVGGAAARRRRSGLLVGAAVVVIAAAVALGVVFTNSNPSIPGSGMSPTAFVVSSTQTTLNQHTADFTMSGDITKGGAIVVPITGSGQIDFTTNSASANATEPISGHTLQIRELFVQGHFYMGFSADGQSISTLTGHDWVDIPVPEQDASSSLGAGNFDPMSQLQLAAKRGATVTPLGTKEVDGVTTSGFAVAPSHAEVLQIVQGMVNDHELTPAQGQQVINDGAILGSETSDLWFDSSGTLRRETINFSGSTAGVAGQVNMDLSNFGTPITIAPPDPSDVISYSQFQQDMQASPTTAS